MSHPVTLAGRFAAGIAALLIATGCTVTVANQPPSESGAPASSPSESGAPASSPSAVPGTAAPTVASPPADAVSIDTLITASTRRAELTSARIKGDSSGTTYDKALSLWAGCEGATDQVEFGVGGHEVVQGNLGLRSAVPDDIVVHVLIQVDGEPVLNLQLDGGDPTPALLPIRFLVEGKQKVLLQTKVVKGSCTASNESYAVLVDGYAH